ncbi:MAG: hypothetical protein JSU61_10980, partial [Fidelibacterota bacterium]
MSAADALAISLPNSGVVLRDIPSSHGDDHITVLNQSGHGLRQFILIGDVGDLFMPEMGGIVSDQLAGDAVDGIFTSGIDIRDLEHVAGQEAAGELMMEIACAGVQMRLDH